MRVLHEGTTVTGYEWIPLDSFISLLESAVPADIVAQCNET